MREKSSDSRHIFSFLSPPREALSAYSQLSVSDMINASHAVTINQGWHLKDRFSHRRTTMACALVKGTLSRTDDKLRERNKGNKKHGIRNEKTLEKRNFTSTLKANN